jgi:hypothetical protein
MAGGWCFATMAGVVAAERRWPRGGSPRPETTGARVATIVLLAFLAAAAAIGASRFPDLLGYTRGHTVFAFVAAGTAALATLIVAAVAMAAASVPLRRR